MSEWSPAKNVRGLFEETASRPENRRFSQPFGSAGRSGPRRAAETSADGRSPSQHRPLGAVAAPPVPHFLDGLLDGLRRRFDTSFIEGTAKVFWACGFFGLFAGMVLVACCEAILAVKAHWLDHVLLGVQSVLTLAVLQYVATKFSDAMKRLFRPALAAGVERSPRLLCAVERLPASRPCWRRSPPS